MKFLRGLLTVVVSFVLIILIFAYTMLITGKDIVQHQLIGDAAKGVILRDIKVSSSDNLDDEEIEEINKSIENLIGYDGANEIIDSVLGEFINYVEEPKSFEVSDETVDLIIKYVEENEKEIEKITDENIKLSDLKKKESREELKEAIKDGFEEIDDVDDEDLKKIVEVYDAATSKETEKTMLIAIVVLVFALVVLSWSTYKWLLPAGISLILSGTLVTAVYGGLNFLKTVLAQHPDFEGVELDPKMVLIAGLGEIAVGIVMIIVRSILNKSSKDKKTADVVVDDRPVMDNVEENLTDDKTEE